MSLQIDLLRSKRGRYTSIKHSLTHSPTHSHTDKDTDTDKGTDTDIHTHTCSSHVTLEGAGVSAPGEANGFYAHAVVLHSV
jgi:hypothetical protein